MYVGRYAYMCVCIYVGRRLCTKVRIHADRYLCMYVCMLVCLFVCLYICNVCMYVCMYVWRGGYHGVGAGGLDHIYIYVYTQILL